MLRHTADDTQNCLQCCIAGMFGLPMEQVPTVHKWSKEHSYWFAGMYEWVKSQGYIVTSIVDDTMDDLYHIAVIREDGKSEYAHAVIAKGTDVVWDPSPQEKAVDLLDVHDWEYSLLFVKVQGKCLQARLEKELTDEVG